MKKSLQGQRLSCFSFSTPVSFCSIAAVSKMKTKYNKEDANQITGHLEKTKLFKGVYGCFESQTHHGSHQYWWRKWHFIIRVFYLFQTLKGEEKEEYRWLKWMLTWLFWTEPELIVMALISYVSKHNWPLRNSEKTDYWDTMIQGCWEDNRSLISIFLVLLTCC